MDKRFVIDSPSAENGTGERGDHGPGLPEDVPLERVGAIAFCCALLLVLGIITYRCRAFRLRQERIAQDREKERLFEMKGAGRLLFHTGRTNRYFRRTRRNVETEVQPSSPAQDDLEALQLKCSQHFLLIREWRISLFLSKMSALSTPSVSA